MKKVSKILCLLLSVVVLVSSLSAVSFSAYAASVGKVTGVVSHTYDTKSITLTWKKVKNASGYKVYKYNSKSKKYKAVATVSKNKAKITKLSPNKTYKFKVRAYKTNGKKKSYGAYSNVYKKSTIANVNIKKMLLSGYLYNCYPTSELAEYIFYKDGTIKVYEYDCLISGKAYERISGKYKIKNGIVSVKFDKYYDYNSKKYYDMSGAGFKFYYDKAAKKFRSIDCLSTGEIDGKSGTWGYNYYIYRTSRIAKKDIIKFYNNNSSKTQVRNYK